MSRTTLKSPLSGTTDDATSNQGKTKRPPAPNRREFLGRAGGATAALVAAGAIGLEPLLGSKRSEARAVEISPFTDDRDERAGRAERIREDAARAEKVLGQPAHASNGDEELYPNRIGNFHKTLPHDPLTGEVNASAYNQFLSALEAGTLSAIDAVPRKAGATGTLLNPLGGLAFNIEGPDSPAVKLAFMPPPIASRAKAAEVVELYWEAYLRDVPFADYNTNPVVAQACADISRFGSDYKGPRDASGNVTPQLLFRYPYADSTIGPMVSQFLMLPYTADGIQVIPKLRARQTVINWNPDGTFAFDPLGRDFLTEFQEWLNAQDGVALGNASVFDATPRFPRNVRDVGHIAGSDNIASTYFRANLILGALGVTTDAGNPYRNNARQGGFATFGGAHLADLIGCAHKAERHTWYHKWFVHRHLRPDGFGGLVNNAMTGRANYPLHPDLLNSPVLSLIQAYNLHLNSVRGKSTAPSFLLPMELPGGSPNHPAAPAGHAVTAGACVTILKAWYDDSVTIVDRLRRAGGQAYRDQIVASRGTGNADGNWPVVPTRDGTGLDNYTGPDAEQLTVRGELNKLMHNLSEGRNMSGVHYRVADNYTGDYQGEEVARRILEEAKATYPEPNATFTWTKLDGATITV